MVLLHVAYIKFSSFSGFQVLSVYFTYLAIGVGVHTLHTQM